MLTKKNTTFMLKKHKVCHERQWIIVDAKGQILGRFASEIAKILRGKHKADFTPHVDSGDGVIIINAKDIAVTGNKSAQKEYIRYTGHIGGLRRTPFRVMQDRKPEYIIRHAVQGMMPKTKLAKSQLTRLRIFVDDNHKLSAQKPIAVEL